MSDQPSSAAPQVLVVEDEYFLAADLKRILQGEGVQGVVLSGSVEDAMARMQVCGFDFALIDIDIRGVMTFRLADECRRRDVPFAFVTGCGRASVPARFADVRLWGKPYDGREIAGGIRSLRRPPMEV